MRRREETSQRPLRGIIEPTVTAAVVVFAGDDVKLRGEVFVRRWRRPSRKLHVIVFLSLCASESAKDKKKRQQLFKKKKKKILSSCKYIERAFARKRVSTMCNSRRYRVFYKSVQFASFEKSFLIYIYCTGEGGRQNEETLSLFIFLFFFSLERC